MTHGALPYKKKHHSYQKQTGKISDAKLSLPSTSLGIGHTRWATHGGVTVDNAHPHLDCTKQIAVSIMVSSKTFKHSKINYSKKATSSLQKPIPKSSPTFWKKNLNISRGGKTFVEAMKKYFSQLHGLNAIVALNATSQENRRSQKWLPTFGGLPKMDISRIRCNRHHQPYQTGYFS